MSTGSFNSTKAIMFLPFIGIVLFVIFYVLAACLYPGGSWRNPDAVGFSVLHNYLCDLLDYYAINGELNPGRYFSRLALGALCLSVFQIWWFLPELFPSGRSLNKLMRISGLLALITICFLSSEAHDTIIYLAGLLGSFALLSCLVKLYRHGYSTLFTLGLICFLLFLVNYYIYESRQFVAVLPLLQKCTMLCMLFWFSLLNLAIIRRRRTE